MSPFRCTAGIAIMANGTSQQRNDTRVPHETPQEKQNSRQIQDKRILISKSKQVPSIAKGLDKYTIGNTKGILLLVSRCCRVGNKIQ
jgi:hypothetical protein